MIFATVTAAVSALIFASGLQAQTADVQPIRFTVFAMRPIAGLEITLRENAAPQKVVFYPTARSPRYEFRGTQPLTFGDGKTGKVAAEATIPPGVLDALLLFSPIETARGEGLAYQVAVLDDSAARQAVGGLAIVNLSGLELSGVVGRHAVILKPGLNPVLPIGRSAQIALRAAVNGRTYQSCADQVDLDPDERALLILFPPFYPGSVEAQSRLLIDRPPAPLQVRPGR